MTESELLQSLRWRYACKKFDSSRKLSSTQIETLLETLRLTPSGYGLQPWLFVLVENPELRAEMVDASFGQAQVREASHLLVLCRKHPFGENEIEAHVQNSAAIRGQSLESLANFRTMLHKNLLQRTPEQLERWAEKEVHIALGQILCACAVLGIDSCPMEGFDKHKVDTLLRLPEKGLRAVLLLPVGVRDPSDKYIALPKVRFTPEQVILRV